jgi:ribose-phosphate pyrophosphokinase
VIKIVVDGSVVKDSKVWKFPGGEMGVNIGTVPKQCNEVVIEAFLKNSDDVMTLLMMSDAFQRTVDCTKFSLILPYFPYARQDRVCNQGESLSVSVFAKLINSMHFNDVIVDDPHSPMVLKYLHNAIAVPQHELMWQHRDVRDFINTNSPVMVAPDKGAAAKVYSHFARHSKLNSCVIQLDKLRDLKTGEVIGLTVDNVFNSSVQGQHLLIVDDICDGGRTFIEAAKLLQREFKPASISLYVSHGIFSKGLEVLHDAGIQNVWCTNSFLERQ